MKRNCNELEILVRCSRGIANEMCRYDGSRIVSELLLSTKDKMVDNWVARGALVKSDADTINELKEQFRTYEFVIRGIRHTVARWASFGVGVYVLSTNYDTGEVSERPVRVHTLH